jgi:hypothetical protein
MLMTWRLKTETMVADEADDSGDELLGLVYVYMRNRRLERRQIRRRRFWVHAVYTLGAIS